MVLLSTTVIDLNRRVPPMQNSKTVRPSAWPMVQRLFKLAGGQRSWFYLALILDLLQAALLILINHYNRRFLEAVSNKDAGLFWMFIWLTLGFSAASIPLSYLKTRGIGQFSERTLAKVRQSVAARSAGLPVAAL